MKTTSRGEITISRAKSLPLIAAMIALGLAGCSGAKAGSETPPASDSPIHATQEAEESTPGPTATQQKAIDKVVALSKPDASASEAEMRSSMERKFSEEDIEYALENSGISLSENATRAARSLDSPRRDKVIRYLVEDRQFTQEQAEYGAENR